MGALQSLDLLTLGDGAHLLVVLLPGKEETYGPLLGRNVPDPTSALREALDSRGIDYLDLAPGFQERAAAGDRLFFEADEHPNPAGQALIARLVEARLEQLDKENAGRADRRSR
jgi:lysophospholipase L1-like esterase